ncbi:MAG TPA: FG-GAP-like repeat-containing protein, partial [Anaerolineae bacterium]
WPRLQSSDPGNAAGAFNENVGVADVDRDGRAEIIGPSDVHYISAFNDDGSQIRANAMFPPTGAYWSQVGVNVDQTADLRGWTECETERRPNFANSAPTIADVNGDGTPEIIVVGNVYNCATDPYTDLYEMPFIFKADRSRWSGSGFDWTIIPPDPGASARPLSEDWMVIENSVPNPVVADLDGDGRKEILYPAYDGRVHAYWLDKTEHGSWPFEVYSGLGYYRFATEPVVADLDNDGKAEVIFASWTQHSSHQPGKLYLVSWDGNLIQSIDLPREPSDDWGGSLAAPTIADIDGDGAPEIVVGTVNMGVAAYDVSGTSNAQILWGTGRGNYQRTGAILNGSLNNSIKTVSDARPDPGEPLTYTIRLINPGPTLSSARVTDTLPSNAFLIGSSVWASSGSWGVGGSVLTWTGAVTQSIGVTATYVMTLSSDIVQPTAIINTALLDDGLGNVQSRTVAAFVNGYAVFLPLVFK